MSFQKPIGFFKNLFKIPFWFSKTPFENLLNLENPFKIPFGFQKNPLGFQMYSNFIYVDIVLRPLNNQNFSFTGDRVIKRETKDTFRCLCTDGRWIFCERCCPKRFASVAWSLTQALWITFEFGGLLHY